MPLISDNQIEHLKQQFKGEELFLVEVEAQQPDADPLQFIFARPDRKTLAAVTKVSSTDPFAGAEVMVKNCLKWGDALLLEDGAVLSAVLPHFEVINKARASTLKKL